MYIELSHENPLFIHFYAQFPLHKWDKTAVILSDILIVFLYLSDNVLSINNFLYPESFFLTMNICLAIPGGFLGHFYYFYQFSIFSFHFRLKTILSSIELNNKIIILRKMFWIFFWNANESILCWLCAIKTKERKIESR